MPTRQQLRLPNKKSLPAVAGHHGAPPPEVGPSVASVCISRKGFLCSMVFITTHAMPLAHASSEAWCIQYAGERKGRPLDLSGLFACSHKSAKRKLTEAP